jgi:hypothetical protein
LGGLQHPLISVPTFHLQTHNSNYTIRFFNIV